MLEIRLMKIKLRLQKVFGPKIVALTTSACFDFDYDIMPLGIFISIRKNFRPKGNVAAHTTILKR